MCGWVGFLAPDRTQSDEALRGLAERMAARLAHRGPDGAGAWTDARAGVAFGFRRLAVVDLSPAGDQPMWSASRRHLLVFNGEVYNASRLRRMLEAEGSAPPFRGHSDTEIALAAIEGWGLETAVGRFVGMFAFALWDDQEKRLFLVRDRMGVKPLYYGRTGRTFLCGSELKALRVHPSFDAPLDREALTAFLRSSYIPAPLTVHEGVRKLLPGTILAVDGRTGREIASTSYWSLRDVAASGVGNRFRGTADDAVEELDRLLRESVALRLVADVPVGVFLSGGIDSSLVTAMAQALGGRPLRTFSVGVSDAAYDEARYARAVAHHLGTEHTELEVRPEDALAVVPRLPNLYDEPFADSSQIPTYLVSALARQHVTVSLSGDGGDELFGGYAHYARARRIWRAIGWMPLAIRRAAAEALRHAATSPWDRLLASAAPAMPRGLHRRVDRDGIFKLASIIASDSAAIASWRLGSRWGCPESILIGGAGRTAAPAHDAASTVCEPVEQMMLLDQMSYLPDDILVKVDRASMGVGLEAREPLLDHRLVEFAWTLPPEMKIRGGETKWPLRRLLRRHLPAALVDRPKMGFSIPIGRWLRGPLRDWAEDLLDERRIREDGLLVPEAVRRRWEEHRSGRHDWTFHLWDLLMLQAWRREA